MNIQWLCALLLVGCQDSRANCREALSEHRIAIFRGSVLQSEELRTGAKAGCEDAEVRSVARLSAQMLSKLPAQARRPLHIHLSVEVKGGPPVLEIETHASGALLVNRAPADETIWLHEYFHTRAGHPKGTSDFVTRSLRAFEEGAADYFAATFAQTPKLGSADGREVRDLSDPKRGGERVWLSFAQGKLDSHTLGLSLARELWAEHGASADLAIALASCMQGASSAAPLSDVSELSKYCPVHTRTAVLRSIQRWTLRDSPQLQMPLALEDT